jgi:hypothetical protein
MDKADGAFMKLHNAEFRERILPDPYISAIGTLKIYFLNKSRNVFLQNSCTLHLRMCSILPDATVSQVLQFSTPIGSGPVSLPLPFRASNWRDFPKHSNTTTTTFSLQRRAEAIR